MEKLAIMYITGDLHPEELELTWVGTQYKYADIDLEYLSKYEGIEKNYHSEIVKLKNIKISSTNYDFVSEGKIFVIEDSLAEDEAFFNDFAFQLKEIEPNPIYNDRFLLDLKDRVKFLTTTEVIENEKLHSVNDIEFSSNEIDVVNKVKEFLSELPKNDLLLNELEEKILNADKLYLDIYDTDGFLSILTDDLDFEFYFDIGDISNSFVPKKKTPFGVFLSHYHRDHYNIMFNHSINAENYLLPYNSSISYKGTLYTNGNKIEFIKSNPWKVTLLLTGATRTRKNIYSKIIKSSYINFLLPKWSNSRNRNMESISVDFHGFAKSVFYPGDTMNYMYSPHLRSFDYFIASHHGGRIGVPNLGTFHMGEIIINSYHSNYLKKDYLSNRLYYGTKASKVTEQISNTGLLGTRITLK